MKHIIEIEIPKHLTEESFKRRIEMLSSIDWIASWWHIDDVRDCDHEKEDDWNSNLTDEQCREVLRLADKYHDSEQGINCYVLEGWIRHLRKVEND